MGATEFRGGRYLMGAAVLLFLFLTVLALLDHGRLTLPLDLAITLFVQKFRNPPLTVFMNGVSWFGYGPQSYLIPALVGIVALFLRRGWVTVYMLTLGLGITVVVGVKLLVHQPRPSPHLVWVPRHLWDPGFPSGHAFFYPAFFGFLALLLPERWRVGRGLLWLFVALVGISRIYLGAHWFTQVLAGYAIGILLFVGVGRELYRRYGMGAGPTRQGGSPPEDG